MPCLRREVEIDYPKKKGDEGSPQFLSKSQNRKVKASVNLPISSGAWRVADGIRHLDIFIVSSAGSSYCDDALLYMIMIKQATFEMFSQSALKNTQSSERLLRT